MNRCGQSLVGPLFGHNKNEYEAHTAQPAAAPPRTPKALALFKQILDVSDDIFSTAYRRLDRDLRRELQLNGIAQGCPCPVIITPDMVPCYPPATLGGHWQHVEGPALFRELCAAADVHVDVNAATAEHEQEQTLPPPNTECINVLKR